MILELPYPPSVNHYWCMWRGRMVISREGRAYRRKVSFVLVSRGGFARSDIEVKIDVYPPDKRRRDLDNVLKALLDSLAHAGVYEDDSQISYLSVQRCDVLAGGKVIVEITETGART